MRRSSWVRTLLVLIIPACGGGGEAPHHTVRFEDGVRVVENRDVGWEDSGAWLLEPRPIIDIGGTEADSLHWLYQVMNARRLRDGRIAVVNSSTMEVRLFGPDGRHVQTIGRAGEGPGEFRAPWSIFETTGDSLVVEDLGGRYLLNLFTPDGVFVRRYGVAVSRGSEGTELLGQFGDGTLLLQQYEREPRRPEPGLQGVTRGYDSYYRISPTGAVLDSLGLFASQSSKTANRFCMWLPRGYGDAAPEGFYFGSATTFEIEARGMDGTLRGLFRLDRPRRTVTSGDIEEWKEWVLARSTRQGNDARQLGAIRSLYERMEFAPILPSHSQVKADADGNAWVQEYSTHTGEGRTWSIFDSTGVYLGDLTMPERLQVFQIGSDFVLGLWRSDLDVEHVRMYRLRKPGATPPG